MGTRITDKLNHLSLRVKLYISFIFFLIIPFLFISSLIINQTRLIMTVNSYQMADENMSRSKKIILESLERALTISDNLTLDKELEELVNRKYSGAKDLFLAYHDFESFDNYLKLNLDINQIRFYFHNTTLLDNSEIIPLKAPLYNRRWYSLARLVNGRVFWGNINIEGTEQNYTFGLSRQISFEKYESRGFLTVELDTERLSEILSLESFTTFLVDDNGWIIAGSAPSDSGSAYYSFLESKDFMKAEPGSYEVNINDIPYRMLVDNIEARNSLNAIRLISLFSISELLKDANTLWRLFFQLTILIMVLTFASLYVVYHLFIERLLKVGRQMDKLAKGNFNSLLPVDGTDEIGKLAVRYNNMAINIQKLMDEIHESNEQKRLIEKRQNEIKIKMLASQINPHFLFNALESIRMKAHIEKQTEIANTVKQLGKLMRSVLAVEGSHIPLKDELKIIESFLEIEQFRLGEELHYEINIAPECRHFPLPPLLLQPLIENAVIHGVEKNIDSGNISLAANLTFNYLEVRIEDNGPGIESETISEILSGSKRNKGNHIGLFNVNQRLILNYGKNAGLQIRNKDEGGLQINFRIPVEKHDV